MFGPRGTTLIFLIVGLLGIAPLVHAQEAEQTARQSKQAEREAMYRRYLEFPSYVKGGSIQPHWMADGSSFWYAEGAPANTVIWKVDPRANPSAGPLGQARGKLRASIKTPLFDTPRLRGALAEVLGHQPSYQGLPFEKFTFVDGEKTVKFTVEGNEFILQLDTYAITRAPALSEQEKSQLVPRISRKGLYGWPDVKEVLSPDGRWFAGLKDYNLWLRSTYDGRSVQITDNGIEDYEWELIGAKWSPDSSKMAVKKVDYRKVPKIPVVHWLKPTEEVEWVRYLASPARVGESLPKTELFIVDILSKRQVRINIDEEPDQYLVFVGWRPDGAEVFFLRANRTFKKLDLVAANPATGATRVILTETQKTFIFGLEPVWHRLFTLLDDGKRFIWLSERDGWRHLYLYEIDGAVIRQLTKGMFPVVRVVAVDEKASWVYFTAHGDQERPYDTHLYRVSLKGKDFSQLTETKGRHDIQFAPSKEFFLDTHSSIARPPVVELRRADGTLLQTLSKANIDALKELKWSPPEEFVVKAADGKTDLYGILYKPYDFDPSTKYPVIEAIYGGPQFSEVPHSFTHPHGVDFHAEHGQALAQLGFVVLVVDGRGTPKRGKAFQDVVYGNFGRYEIPDHLAALKQLAAKRPYMDLSRVGILGHSLGGYFAIRAMLLAPDVYHVGIATSPGVDLFDEGSLVEAYMGLPQTNKEGYEYASNLRLAGNLEGKLLLIQGTSDLNATFSRIMKMIEALIRAGKPYDLIVLPEQAHQYTGRSRTYAFEAIRRYFQEHLKP